jgi:very-short-patch-repair endonuclease
MTYLFNRHEEREKRRDLRNNATRAETMLWNRLRGKQINNLKFRRQASVGPYVLDFYCPELKLALELDGPSHDSEEAQAYDRERQRYIEALGIRFLRFTNAEIYINLEGVLSAIAERTTPQPPPS